MFLDEKTKVASIGVQVRHRLTAHGFAMNVTSEPRAWFDTIVACGLADVKAGSIAGRSRKVKVDESESESESGGSVGGEVPGVVRSFGRVFEREVLPLDLEERDEVSEAIVRLEREAQVLQSERPAPRRPLL